MDTGLNQNPFSQVSVAVIIIADTLLLKILKHLNTSFHHCRCSGDIKAGFGGSLEHGIRYPVRSGIPDDVVLLLQMELIFFLEKFLFPVKQRLLKSCYGAVCPYDFPCIGWKNLGVLNHVLKTYNHAKMSMARVKKKL